MRLDLFEKTQGFECLDYPLARLEAIQSGIGLRRLFAMRAGISRKGDDRELRQDAGIAIKHIDQRQVMALADLVVIEIMGRGNLDAAGAKLGIDILVSNNRNLAADDRQRDRLPDQMPVTLVLGMHGHGGVA